MASPFTIFRKHQRILIAVLGLMAMVAFVFLPIILKSMQSGGGGGNPAVVTTDKFGDLNENGIRRLIWQRQVVRRFVQRAGLAATGMPVQPQVLDALFGPVSEESVVDSWLMGQYAHEMGMRISDSIVRQFIQRITDDRLSGDELTAIANEMKISEDGLFVALKNELASLYFKQLYFASPGSLTVALLGTTPAERWEYFQRLRRSATTQMIPVPVEKFVSKVADPDDKVLKEFFEKYKTDYADPSSPEPGFHEPRRVKIEYIVAKRETFADPEAVTEEEIKDYYEKNKNPFFVRTDLPSLMADETTPPEPETPKPETTEPAKEEPPKKEVPASEPAKTEPPKTEPPKTEPPKTEPPKTEPAKDAPKEAEAKKEPAAEKPASETPKKPEAKPADPKPADPKPEEPKSEAAPKPEAQPKPEESTSIRRKSVFQLVSDSKTSEPDADATKPEASTDAPSPNEGDDAATYVPLEEVKEVIRNRIADEQAAERIEKAFKPIREQMSQFREKWVLAAAMREEDDEQSDAPPRPKLAEMAGKANLEFVETPFVDMSTTVQLPIGSSTIDGSTYFVRAVFQDNGYPEFRPGVSEDVQGNQYLFWIVGEKPERVPEFDDEGIREEVLKAWKMIEARKLAEKEAESLIEKAKKAGKSLKDEFGGKPGIDVLEPPAFTWLTLGMAPSMSMRPRFDDVKGVEMPGRDFMKAVFSLAPGQFGVAMNNPETVAYAVEMIKTEPPSRNLWEDFRDDDFSKYVSVAYQDQFERISTWRKDLEEEAGLKWERKAEEYRSQ